MNVLLIGSGAREHAIAWRLSQSKIINRLFAVPGNPGIENVADCINIDIKNFNVLKNFILENNIEMVVVGPEQPLVDGLQDDFLRDEQLKSIAFIGPCKAGAQLEGSKDFAKLFMQKNDIPTAKYKTFTKATLSEGIDFLKSLQPPYVLKADGLAAGKGVVICNDLEEAKIELTEMLSQNKFGKASEKVVIEEFLKGIELSVFVLTDGSAYKMLPAAKDYKRIGEGDAGKNTGGMGAVSPLPFADSDFMKKVEDRIVLPTLQGLRNENIRYQGFLFVGLMNVGGDPYVIEYNVRMGDPETEVVMQRIQSDIGELFVATVNGTLDQFNMQITDQHAACVVLVSEGYPDNYEKGKVIKGLDETKDCQLFHAGTAKKEQQILSNGGRVIVVSARGNTLQDALSKAYENAGKIQFEGKYYRQDIGKDILNYSK